MGYIFVPDSTSCLCMFYDKEQYMVGFIPSCWTHLSFLLLKGEVTNVLFKKTHLKDKKHLFLPQNFWRWAFNFFSGLGTSCKWWFLRRLIKPKWIIVTYIQATRREKRMELNFFKNENVSHGIHFGLSLAIHHLKSMLPILMVLIFWVTNDLESTHKK